MDKSSASYHQLQSTGRRTIPASDIMTPPPTQMMISPSSSTSQPTETSVSSRYLKIIEDTVGKSVLVNQMSEVFAQLAEKFKEEEGRDATTPSEIPMGEPESQPSNTSPSSQGQILLCNTAGIAENLEQRSNVEGEVEGAQELVEEKLGVKTRELVDVDELESGDE